MGFEQQLHYLLKLLFSIALGFCIGFERKQRYKEAGIRTHAIVAAGACLMTIISKYGFTDVGADGARVAAQIVSGIGFIGAGMILYKRQALQGLTTAAGIWTTAGIGMAAGVGMYWLALGASAAIVFIQCILHLPLKLFKMKRYTQIKIEFTANGDESEKIKQLFDAVKFTRVAYSHRGGDIFCSAVITTGNDYSAEFLQRVLSENPFVISLERSESE